MQNGIVFGMYICKYCSQLGQFPASSPEILNKQFNHYNDPIPTGKEVNLLLFLHSGPAGDGRCPRGQNVAAIALDMGQAHL